MKNQTSPKCPLSSIPLHTILLFCEASIKGTPEHTIRKMKHGGVNAPK